MDDLDKRILNELVKDSNRSVRELAKTLKESASTVYNRVKRLETAKIIKNWTINIDYSAIDLETCAVIFIEFDHRVPNTTLDNISDAICKVNGVMEILNLSGEFDILIKIRAKNLSDLNEIYKNKIKSISGVGRCVIHPCFSERKCKNIHL